MPVTYGTYVKQIKLLPLTIFPDDRASVSVRFGYVGESGVFEPMTEQVIQIAPEGVREILDATPTHGLSRRDDLAYAVYTYLVKNGLIEAGHIS
jgi:hypothetical protein